MRRRARKIVHVVRMAYAISVEVSTLVSIVLSTLMKFLDNSTYFCHFSVDDLF